MLTLHHADLLLPGGGRPPVPGGAVLVDGRVLAAAGPFERLAAAHPGARVRRWPGIITPGLCTPYGPELLEHAYHPDPREAGALGTEPLTGAALDALDLSEARWGASARRGVRLLLAHGVVAVAGDLRRHPVAEVVRRAGLGLEERFEDPPGPATPDAFRGRPAEEAFLLPLLGDSGLDADFAVFAVPADGDPYAALAEGGAGTCVATVLAGRLVHRRA